MSNPVCFLSVWIFSALEHLPSLAELLFFAPLLLEQYPILAHHDALGRYLSKDPAEAE